MCLIANIQSYLLRILKDLEKFWFVKIIYIDYMLYYKTILYDFIPPGSVYLFVLVILKKVWWCTSWNRIHFQSNTGLQTLVLLPLPWSAYIILRSQFVPLFFPLLSYVPEKVIAQNRWETCNQTEENILKTLMCYDKILAVTKHLNF